jgi:hypothetical protein
VRKPSQEPHLDRSRLRLAPRPDQLRFALPHGLGVTGANQIGHMIMKIERFAGHHEAREALVLSIAGVTVIMLIESLILLILF